MKSVKNERLPKWIFFGGLFAILFAGLAAIPEVRDVLRHTLRFSERQVLAKLDVDFTGQGERATVIKVKSLDTLAVEIYFFDQPDKAPSEIKRIVLNEKRDGHFDFNGNAFNLVATDVDSDGVLELIIPSFDANLIPRLNVFKFDPKDRSFNRMGPESFPVEK